MAITFQEAYTKFQTLSGSTNATNLLQAKQDINIGYARFNAAIARYFTRKQGFADIVANQRYYQTPVDAIRVSNVTITVPGGNPYPLEQVQSEQEWRYLLITPSYSSSFITHYFVYGNDQIGLYPLPSTAVSSGLRYVYQPSDVFLTKDDYTTGTITLSNGGVTVTGVGTSWSQASMGMMQFQVTDGSDGNWYDILAVNSTTSITLKTPYVGPSVAATTYRLGQLFIFPTEYDDTPVDYALSRFWESRSNPARAQYHLNKYQASVDDAVEKYATSSLSNVITGENEGLNLWLIPPISGT